MCYNGFDFSGELTHEKKMTTVSLAVSSRQLLGRAVRASRRQGLVPANIVSKGQKSRAIEAPERNLMKVLDQVGYTQPVEIEIDQKDKLMVLVTNVQFLPTRRTCQHVVFQEVRRGEKVTVNVPVALEGDSPGVTAGWLLIQAIYELEVTAGALSLPEQIVVDASRLTEDNLAIRVKDLDLPDGVITEVDPETPVARLEKSRAAVSKDDESAESAEDDESGEGDEAGDSDDSEAASNQDEEA